MFMHVIVLSLCVKREDFMTKTVDFKAKINALNENINGLKFEYD